MKDLLSSQPELSDYEIWMSVGTKYNRDRHSRNLPLLPAASSPLSPVPRPHSYLSLVERLRFWNRTHSFCVLIRKKILFGLRPFGGSGMSQKYNRNAIEGESLCVFRVEGFYGDTSLWGQVKGLGK